MIQYISARNGELELWNENRCVEEVSTAKGALRVLQEYGFDGNVYTSSSMDFASEYGFETDDCAKNLWNDAVTLYNATVCYS